MYFLSIDLKDVTPLPPKKEVELSKLLVSFCGWDVFRKENRKKVSFLKVLAALVIGRRTNYRALNTEKKSHQFTSNNNLRSFSNCHLSHPLHET